MKTKERSKGKRRALILSGATLILLVSVGVIMLANQRVRYRFMEGARYEYTSVGYGPTGDLAVKKYAMVGTVQSIKNAATEELTAWDGWACSWTTDGYEFYQQFQTKPKYVSIGDYTHPPGRSHDPNRPVTVAILIAEPATPQDRFLAWLSGL